MQQREVDCLLCNRHSTVVATETIAGVRYGMMTTPDAGAHGLSASQQVSLGRICSRQYDPAAQSGVPCCTRFT